MQLQASMILTAALLVAADGPKGDTAKGDLDKLQGTWKIVSEERDGKMSSEEHLSQHTVTIEGDKYSIKVGENGPEIRIKLDPSKKPKEINYAPYDGGDPGKDPAAMGIYELDGDTLKTCTDMSGKTRPKKFASKAGEKLTAYRVLKRVK